MNNIQNRGKILEIGEQYLITSVNRKTYFSESIYEKDEIKIKRVQGWNSGEWLVTISDDDELEALTAQLKEDASEKSSFWDLEEIDIQAEDDGWYEESEMLQGYFNLAEQANAEITNSTNRTPTQLVDMWVMKLRGYTYDATTRSRLISYVEDKSGVGSTQPLLNTDDITEYSNYQRITHTLVGLILMAPDAIRR